MTNEELVGEIASGIGALMGSTRSREAIKLLNEMLLLLFEVQAVLEDE